MQAEMDKCVVSLYHCYPFLPLLLILICSQDGVVSGSGLGLQQFKEQFVHRHTAVLFDAAEVLDGTRCRLTQERESHDEFAGTPWVLWMLGGLVILEGSMEDILESLYCLGILNVHGV